MITSSSLPGMKTRIPKEDTASVGGVGEGGSMKRMGDAVRVKERGGPLSGAGCGHGFCHSLLP